MQLEAGLFNVNIFTNMEYLLRDFYKFWLINNKTLEGYIKIHGPQHPPLSSTPKDNSKFKSHLQKYLV